MIESIREVVCECKKLLASVDCKIPKVWSWKIAQYAYVWILL
jgi:hypothetical protein